MNVPMLKRATLSLTAGALLLCAAVLGQAHHSFAAQYDNKKPFTKKASDQDRVTAPQSNLRRCTARQSNK